eukprot:jgi/Botrbrau1/13822/Bobra.0056s0064.1
MGILGIAMAFTPVQGLLGGVAIGTVAAATVLINGRVMGLSGVLRGAFRREFHRGKGAFLGGLVGGASILRVVAPRAFDVLPPTFTVFRGLLAGLFVGIGTSMGNGCTSGHGICGLSRLSIRSLAFTMTFMVSGALAAVLSQTGKALGIALKPTSLELPNAALMKAGLGLVVGAAGSLSLLGWAASRASPNLKKGMGVAADALSGLFFALGVGFAGMTRPTKVAAFLEVTSPFWDPTLAFVMGGALMVALPAFQYVLRSCTAKGESPVCAADFQVPTSSTIDARLLTGGVLFGVGWGLGGICPGPAIVDLIHPSSPLLAWFLGYGLGVAADAAITESGGKKLKT